MDSITALVTGIIAIGGPVVGGLVTAVVHLYTENTKRTVAELMCQREVSTLRERVLSLQALMEERVDVGVAQVVINNRGQIVEWSSGATLLMHWLARDILGKMVTKIMPERYRDKHVTAVSELAASKQPPIRGPIIGHVLTKDGAEVPVEISLSSWMNTDGSTLMAAEIRRRNDDSQYSNQSTNAVSPAAKTAT